MSISNIESGDRRLDVLGLLDLRIMPLLVIPQHLLERVLLAQSSGYPRRGIAEKTKLRLSNNTVLITGGATGIGYAMAEAFLESGSAVATTTTISPDRMRLSRAIHRVAQGPERWSCRRTGCSTTDMHSGRHRACPPNKSRDA